MGKGEPARQTGEGDRRTLGMSCLRTVPYFSGTGSQKDIRSLRERIWGSRDSWSLREEGSVLFSYVESWRMCHCDFLSQEVGLVGSEAASCPKPVTDQGRAPTHPSFILPTSPVTFSTLLACRSCLPRAQPPAPPPSVLGVQAPSPSSLGYQSLNPRPLLN